MNQRTIRRAVTIASAIVLVLGGTASAQKECSSLPTSALRTRQCNPQDDCLEAIPKDAKGGQLEARRRECSRLPTSGVCHGPESYNPQAECREGQRKK